MKFIKVKPTSPGRRFVVRTRNTDLYEGKPCSLLTTKKNKHSGRNSAGRITVRHQGGGQKQRYRLIDFKRKKDDILAKVERIEYDPNRTGYIALLLYSDGERRYIIAPKDLSVGMKVISGDNVTIQTGNCMPIYNISLGTVVHNVEIKPGKGAQMIRSAGTSARIVAKDDTYATLRLSSGEVRKVLLNCRAAIGAVSNPAHNLISLGKAGASRWRGIRPTVRGVAMNPVDHPHGGGEGRSSGGGHPVTPWGVQTKGKKTRKNKRSDKMIIQRRK